MARSNRLLCLVALGAFGLAAPAHLSANTGLKAIATEVYRLDFENGTQGIDIVGPTVSVTAAPGEVLSGQRSLKLEGIGAAIVLDPSVIRLESGKTYIVEYRYRALSSVYAWALGVGFSHTGSDGQPTYIPLRGPLQPAGSVGIDARSARAGSPYDAFVFHTWNGSVIIDDIRILRHDVQASAPTVPLITAGFPRLANYQLLAPDGIALINNATQDQVEAVGSRYDLMMGTSFDHTVGAAGWVRQMHLLNPSLGILPYKQAFMAQFAGGVDNAGLLAEFNAGLSPTWFMLTPGGSVINEPAFPQNVQLNHTPFAPVVNGRTVNSYTGDFLADSVLGSGLWTGIHFDQPEWYINPLLGTPPPEVDLTLDGTAESTSTVQHAWALGFFDYFKTMSARLGANALLYGNAGHIPGNPFVLPMLNGWQAEVVSPYAIAPGGDWVTDAPSQWYRLFQNYQLATVYSRAPQMVSLQFTGRELGTQTGQQTPNGYPNRAPQLEARDFRRMRLGLTTALLANGFYEYDLVDNTTPPQWFDEYAVNASGNATTALSGKGYLGQPLAAAQELLYASQVVFNLDFESGGSAPAGVYLGPGTVTSDPAKVIAGQSSFVVQQDDISEGKWIFNAPDLLTPGKTYQLFADYRILEYRPTTYNGLFGLGFRDEFGGMGPERSASLYLPDSGGAGQQGTLRAALKVSRTGTPIVGGLTDTGAIAFDNIKLVEGTGGVWRRDFENGIVLVNPTPEPLFVSQADIAGNRGRTGIRRISGTQAPTWNNGAAVTAGLWLPPGDGIVLLATTQASPTPSAVGQPTATVQQDGATLTWPTVPEYVAGYLIRYGESANHLTRSVAAGPLAWIQLGGLSPGTTYVARITAHDFLGHEGPSRELTFTTTGASPDRPIFSLPSHTSGLAPGSVAALTGTRLANGAVSAPGPSFATTLGGVEVRINGIAAAILSVAPEQVTFLVPWNVVGPDAVIALTRDGVAAPERSAPIVAAHPWIFTWPGGDIAIATHADGSLVSGNAPAERGTAVDILAAGLGAVLLPPAAGTTVESVHPSLVTTPIQVTVGGAAATVIGAWLVPGNAATYGIRVIVPTTAPSGLQSVNVIAGGETANTAFLLVQ